MEIKQFAWDVVDANSWLMTENNHGLLIDAVDNPELYEALRPLESLTVILTHCHFDHICGLNSIREIRPDCAVISTQLCSEQIGNQYRNMSAAADAFMVYYDKGKKSGAHIEPFTCRPAEKTFEDHLQYPWLNHTVELTAVHGHSADSLLAEIDGQILFTGDTLLPIPTITRLRGGNTRKFQEEDLPLFRGMKDVPVYPGHKSPEKLSVLLTQYPENDHRTIRRIYTNP